MFRLWCCFETALADPRGTGDIEADYLNGEICYLGRLHGIATPANEALRVLANDAVKNAAEPGVLTADDIYKAIESFTPTSHQTS